MNPYRFWFSSKGWRALWIALRRSPRDSRARRNLLRLLASCIPFIAYIAFYAYFIHGAVKDLGLAGAVAMSFGGGVMICAALIAFLWQKREESAYERQNPSVAKDLKVALHRETCLLATLLERLGSEVGMEKELPPGIEVITRRVLLDRLARLNLREDLEPWLLDILLAPDGHWSPDLKTRAMRAWECLAALRWVLGLGELRELTMAPKYSLAEARAICEVKAPEKLNVLPSWDIRPMRNAADMFFSRCWSELTARRELENVAEEDVTKAIHIREAIAADGYTGDFLIGAQTIAELPSETLWFAALRAYHRWQTLSLLVDITSGEKPVSDLRALFAEFFAPAPVETVE